MSEPLEKIVSPYPGLRPFRMDEDYLFFGREEQTAELVRLLREHRFLAVVGRSGSGKSSLVRAGLLPSIQGGMMQHASSAWEIAVLRPGGHPIRNLAECLISADLYDPDDDEALPRLLATLNHSAMGLVQAYSQSDFEDDTNLLIVVDQFEELFRFEQTDRKAKDEAHAFVELLLEASRTSEVPIYIILTMRSDYLGDCAQVPGLAEAVNRGEYLIPRLERAQLRVAIEGPAKVGGGTVSYRLVQHLLNELGDEEDQLPVLQHALMRTWSFWHNDHAEGEEIDLRHYESSGGMKLAISNHADEIFDSLPNERHRLVAERLFRTLTVKGDDGRGVRRPTRLDQLSSVAREDSEVVKAVIDAYRKPGVTFLMPGVEVDLADDTVIDLSHESLMRVWERLRRWVDTEAQSARIYGRLVDTAELHAESKAGLYHNPDLEIALAWRNDENPNESWANQYGGGFDRAMAFLEESERQAQRLEQETEKARQRELEQVQALAKSRARSAALLKRFSIAVGVTCLIAIGLAFWATQQSRVAKASAERARQQTVRANRAEKEATKAAEAERLAALAAEQAQRQAEIAAAEATAAETNAKMAQGRTWLANAKALADTKDQFSARLKAARALGFQGYGREKFDTKLQDQFPVLLQPERQESKSLWATAESLIESSSTSQLLWTSGRAPQHTGNVVDFALHPDGKILASVDQGGLIHLWDTEQGSEIQILETRIVPSELTPATVTAIAFSPDGEYFLAASDQIEVFQIDADGNFFSVEGPLPQLRRMITSMAFSSDGERLVLALAEGGLYISEWWRQNERPPQPLQTPQEISKSGKVKQLAFHPLDDQMLTVVTQKNCFILLMAEDLLTEIQASILSPIETHKDGQPFHSLAFSPDGKWLAIAGERVPVTIWDVSDRKIFVDDVSGKRTWNVANWKHFATVLDDEWALLTSPETRRTNSLRFVGQSIAFSPDASQLAVSWHDASKGDSFRFYPNNVTVFDISSESEAPVRLGDIRSDNGPFTKARFSNDGQRLYLSRAGRLAAWNLDTWLPMDGEPVAHAARIHSLAFSRDGFCFASGDHDGGIRIWDARTGELRHTLKKHVGNIIDLQFNADGSKLFSAGNRDRLLCVWDVESGELVESIENERTIVGLDLTRDGRSLMVSGWYPTVFDYDADTLALRQELEVGHGGEVRLLPDGKHLAVFRNYESSMSDLTICDLKPDGSTEIVSQWRPLHDVYWGDFTFHPDGNLLVIVFQDGTVKAFERRPDRSWKESSETMRPFRESNITQVEFDPRGQRIMTATSDGQIKLWDFATRDLLEVLPGTRPITSLKMSPNGELLLTGDDAGVLRLWSIPPIKQAPSRPIVVGTQNAPNWVLKGSRVIALAPRRRLLFSTGAPEQLNEIITWRIQDGRLTRAGSLSGLSEQPGALAVSADERYLVSAPAMTTGDLMLWDLETGESRQLDQIAPLTALAFSPDGKTIAGSIKGPDASQRISLWDINAAGPPVSETDLLPAPVVGLAFTNDGKQLISTVKREGHPVQFWDIDPEQGELSLALELPAPPHQPMKLAVSPDGKRLAVAFSGGQGRIWDLPASADMQPDMIAEGALYSLAFSPDGSLLATGGFGGYLSVLTTDSMEPVLQSGGDQTLQNLVSDLAFDADGNTLFVSRNDGRITSVKINSAGKIIPPAAYLSLFDMEEVFNLEAVSGALSWKERNARLSPPVRNFSFAPLSAHYLTEIRNERDPLQQRIRLFETYLGELNFPAAEGLLFAMDQEFAGPLKETLVKRLADHLVELDAGVHPSESKLELADRLLEEFPDAFDLQLATVILRGQWNRAAELLQDKAPIRSASEHQEYVRSFFDALNLQIAGLHKRGEAIDLRAVNGPLGEWVLASALTRVSRELEELMSLDQLIAFSVELEDKPAAQKLLDEMESQAWKTDPVFKGALAKLRELDPARTIFPAMDAFAEDLSPHDADAPRLWRLRARTYEQMGLYEQALAAAQSRLAVLEGDDSPAAIRESKLWWQWWERKILRKIDAPAEEIDAVVQQFNEIPERPEGLDPKMIDLTDFYAVHLFDSPDLGDLPETFTPQHGVDFDLRGVFQLGSGGGYKDHLPERFEGIPVGQKSNAIHFLMGAMNGDDLGQVEVATILIHFVDGTTATRPLINKVDICDWFQWFDAYRMPEERRGWSGHTHNPFGSGLVPVALAEVVWENPSPEKTISHIDIISQRTKSAPFVVAISLE